VRAERPARPWAVLPVKRFCEGKSRLAGILGANERAALARALCEHVLGVLAACPALGGTLVVTDGEEVAALARARAADVLLVAAASLGEAVESGLAEVTRRGAEAALVLMADLPLVQVEEIAVLLGRLVDADVVLAPDRRGQGTNALGLVLPPQLPLAFGQTGSYTRHLTEARARCLRLVVQQSPGLGLDVDEPEDWREVLVRDAGWVGIV
jgi:2-phospho-L-lactate guanylyltransferase